jgi:PiT family inorganic phosphate transporter
MAANRSGLQKDTLISILMAWVLTLPVCIFLGATLFSAALFRSFRKTRGVRAAGFSL